MLNQILKILPWTQPIPSKDDAKRRLKVVIAHDRVGLTPEIMEAMRQEIVAVIARYVEVDMDDMEFSLENDNRLTALTANFPIKKINLEGLPTEPVQSAEMDPQLEAPEPPLTPVDNQTEQPENTAASLAQGDEKTEESAPSAPAIVPEQSVEDNNLDVPKAPSSIVGEETSSAPSAINEREAPPSSDLNARDEEPNKKK